MTIFEWAKTLHFTRMAAYGVWLLFAPLLVVAGLTGAIQAFYYEIDEALNPGFYNVPVTTLALPLLVIAVTSIDMNLADEVFKPVVSVFSKVSPVVIIGI